MCDSQARCAAGWGLRAAGAPPPRSRRPHHSKGEEKVEKTVQIEFVTHPDSDISITTFITFSSRLGRLDSKIGLEFIFTS